MGEAILETEETMTFEELFPEERYPVRRRASFEVPRKGLVMYSEIYSELPLEEGGMEQAIGEYVRAASKDKTLVLGIAKTIDPERGTVYYLEQDGALVRINAEEAERLLRKFERAFQEKYDTIIIDEATADLIDALLDQAQWESF